MLIRRNVIRLGPVSKVISLPLPIAKLLNPGDVCVFDIKFIRKLKEKINEYKCKKCESTSFFKENDSIYCTACGCEDMELVRERK